MPRHLLAAFRAGLRYHEEVIAPGAQTAIWSLKSSDVPSTQKIFLFFFSIAQSDRSVFGSYPHRMISARGYSLRLYQTAIQGPSLPPPSCEGRLPVLAPGALETHAFPTSAIQIDSSRSVKRAR